jgi:hypothetical protein
MSLVVTVLAFVVAVLTLLVVGLLRSHAVVLRQLHELTGGDPDTPTSRAPTRAPAVPREAIAAPTGRRAADVVGVDARGTAVALRVVGTDHDTVLAFLSSTCLTCAGFWEELRRPVDLPAAARLVIVAKGADEESPSAIADLAPRGVTTVLSSAAWEDYEVPGSPYVVCVDGPTGRVKGEGTGGSWAQVANLLAQATGDLAFTGATRGARPKARPDAERESDIDAALLAAGVLPGDERLYQTLDEPPGT